MPKPTVSSPILANARVPGTLDADAPEAPDALPLMPDDVGYVIPVSFQSTGLPVRVPALWGGTGALFPGEMTAIVWLWNDVPFDTKEVEAPYDATDLPQVDSVVPPHLMDAAGLHNLHYQVFLREGSGNPPRGFFCNPAEQCQGRAQSGATRPTLAISG